MFRTTVAYFLMALQILLSPLTYAYPVLTCLGPDIDRYFSSTTNEGSITPESAEKVYAELPGNLQEEDGTKDLLCEYSDVLIPIVRGLDGMETTTELKEGVRQHIRGEAQRYIQSSTHHWLSQYGTAKVEVQLDKNFNLDSSEVDFLFPFAVKRQGPEVSAWFVQPGFVANSDRYYEGRNFAHIGVGYRAKNEHVFYGLNAFYDYDTDRHHKRASVGVEYGLSHIKLAGNFYFRLSQWQDSQDPFSSPDNWILMERPANGVDVDISGYLPDFPWLSLSANFQQFFGDRIEVSTGGDPIKDPCQLAIALNYQPVPLLTFNAGYSREKGGDKGLNAGASFTYVFGIPFEKQIDPGEVGILKSPEAQLFKLVERDHNIRLEYRKKESAFTARFTQSQYEVVEGSDINLSNWLIVSNPSEVASTRFSGTAVTIVPVGSGVVQGDQADYFHAPAYQRQTSANSNQYTLTGVVTLKNGQVVSIPPAVIIVKPGEIIASLVERGSPVEPDGEAFVMVTATVEDAGHHPLTGQTVAFPEVPDISIVDAGSSTTDSNGQVTKKISSSKAGTYTVVAEFHEQSRSVDVVFSDRPSPLPGDLSDTYSSMVEKGSPALANGTAPVTIIVMLKNDDGNPVAGQAVSFPEVSGLIITAKNTTTDDHGQAFATVTSTKAGTYSVTAESNGQTWSVDLIFRADPATADITNAFSSVAERGSPAQADGMAVITVIATLKDAYGNPVPDQTVTFPAVAGLDITAKPATTDDHGQIAAQIASTEAGNYVVKAELNGVMKPVNVMFSANPETASITSIVESGSPSSADGTDGIVVTATLKDAIGNPVPGQIVTFPEVTGLTIVEHDRMTNVDGRVTASVTSTIADKYTVIADYQGKSRSIDVVFKANQATAEVVSVANNGRPVIADGSSLIKVTATVKDAEGNPVPNQIVSFPPVAGLTIKGSGEFSSAEGQVTVDVTSMKAGSYIVSAEYKGKMLSTEVHFIAGPANSVTLSATEGDLFADNSATKNLIATVADADGNPVDNAEVTFSVPADSGATLGVSGGVSGVVSGVHTNTEGQAVTSIKGSTVGTVTVTAQIAVSGTHSTASAATAATKVVFVPGPPL